MNWSPTVGQRQILATISMRTAIISALFLLCEAAFAATEARYAVLYGERRAGTQVTTVAADGLITTHFSYRDNGRGPDLRERIRISGAGAVELFRAEGTSAFGASIDETFTLERGRAQWQSMADTGRITVDGAVVYVPVECSPEMYAVIARAIARQPGRRIAALPSGELAIEKVTETVLDVTERRAAIALYAITGVSTEPYFLWLSNDATQRFFARITPWRRIIEEGWESQAATLEALQAAAEEEWLERLTRRLTHRLAEPILIRNVRILDVEHARLGDPADVYVHHGKIAAVYEAGSIARDAGTIIDGAGRVLSPALFDMHTHEDAWNLVLQIAGGVTTSRDMGSYNEKLAALMTRIEAGKLVGPRVMPAGYIEGASQFQNSGGFVVTDLQGALDAVDWYAQRGFRQIKLYNSFHRAWVRPTVDHAHRRGLRVSGHVPAFMRADEVVLAGYDEIQHINQAMLGFFARPGDDTRTLARFHLIADNAHAFDLRSPQARSLIDLMKARGTSIDVTLATFEGMFTQKQGEMNPAFAAVAAHVPAAMQRRWRTNTMKVTDANASKYRASYARMVDFTGQLHRAGVPLLAGTDGFPGFMLHRELELLVKAGLSAAEALRVATWNGAKYTGMLAELGSVELRKSADLILIDGDPTSDIAAIRRISLVMKQGAVFFPAEIYEAVGVRRFVDPPVVVHGDVKRTARGPTP